VKQILWKNIKKIIYIFLIVYIILNVQVSYATDKNEILKSQQENFGISDFIKEAEKYKGKFLEETDIEKLFSDVISGKIDNSKIYNKILNILGTEIRTSIKSLISVLVIVIIHSILKSITDDLENKSISQIIYFVEYILIVTVIMSNFLEIIDLVKETSQNLVGFINVLMPLLITLMIYTGSIVTSNLIQPIILFLINFIGNMIENILIPLVLVITVLIIVSKISNRVQIDKIAKFFKTSIVWFLGIVLTLFVGVVSLEGTLGSSIDGITAKTAKATVSSMIPVVGKILGDTVDTVLGCGVILKNAIGIVGVIIIIGICILPIIKIGVLSAIYSLATVAIQPIGDEKIVKLLEEMSGIFKILFGILCAISVMLIIGVALVIKISNSGMMYR